MLSNLCDLFLYSFSHTLQSDLGSVLCGIFGVTFSFMLFHRMRSI